MNKRLFIIILVVLVAFLAGWIYYISSQAKQAASIERISVDWWGSAHADVTARAFTFWNGNDPAEIPPNCAKCHSGPSFIDFLGQDGSTEFSVDQPGPIERVITCEVCHNEKANALEMVTFPSGEMLNLGLGNALCGSCHSGLSAGSRVASVVAEISDDDQVPEARFITPHYYYAATTLYGSEAKGGYEYADASYVGKFYHAEPVQTCTQCHDPHSLRINRDFKGENVNLCATCHSNVTGFADYKEIFVDGVDYDADGTVEGMYHEIQGVQAVLYEAIQLYAKEVIGTPIIWADRNPYLFVDTNGNGEADEDEVVGANAYTEFTPRLMRAGFNYQFSIEDPGAYIHNGKYILQLMVDSIADLASVVDFSFSGLVRPAG
jgi:predicted CXXCH cytochrome family protein